MADKPDKPDPLELENIDKLHRQEATEYELQERQAATQERQGAAQTTRRAYDVASKAVEERLDTVARVDAGARQNAETSVTLAKTVSALAELVQASVKPAPPRMSGAEVAGDLGKQAIRSVERVVVAAIGGNPKAVEKALMGAAAKFGIAIPGLQDAGPDASAEPSEEGTDPADEILAALSVLLRRAPPAMRGLTLDEIQEALAGQAAPEEPSPA